MQSKKKLGKVVQRHLGFNIRQAKKGLAIYAGKKVVKGGFNNSKDAVSYINEKDQSESKSKELSLLKRLKDRLGDTTDKSVLYVLRKKGIEGNRSDMREQLRKLIRELEGGVQEKVA